MRLPLLHSQCALRVATLALFFGFFGSLGVSVAAESRLLVAPNDSQGNLAEVKDKNRVALLIIRSSVIDASGSDEPIVAEALAAEPREALRHRYPYRLITRKLNAYMRKYRSMHPVYEIGQADFIIYFKLVEYRRMLNGVYPYGELFVVVNPPPDDKRPARVIWKTRKVIYAEDAVEDLVKELKRVREER